MLLPRTDIADRDSGMTGRRESAFLTGKTHWQQSELSWLRETDTKISGRSFMDKLDKVREISLGSLDLPSKISGRQQQMVREGCASPPMPSSR